MTADERALLPSLIDKVVALETVQGDRMLAQVLIVFDEGETPDLFCVEVEPGPDGAWVRRENAGHSILLDDIVRVTPQVEPKQ